MAVRSFWSDLEKFPKSVSGEIFGGVRSTFWAGDLLGQKNGPEKDGFVEE